MKKITLKQISKTLENLVIMVKQGFDSVDERFTAVDLRFNRFEQQLKTEIEQSRNEILLKLGNYAYKFEVDDLKHRVKKVEKKIVI